MGTIVAKTKTRDENPGLGSSALTRRERLERIAAAERDRRADRTEMAVAAIGEAVEWPARAVLALARLPESEGAEVRRLLEEGLDVWARETGLGSLEAARDERPEIASELASQDPTLEIEPDAPVDRLDRPFDATELDRAFEQAKAEVEEMHDFNRVAERVLMDEPIGCDEFAGDELAPVDAASMSDAVASRDDLGMDAADRESMDAVRPAASQETPMIGPSGNRGLAALDRWLQNIERRMVRRVQ